MDRLDWLAQWAPEVSLSLLPSARMATMHCRYPASIQVLEAQKKALVVMQQTLDPLSHLPGLKQGFKKNTSGKKS